MVKVSVHLWLLLVATGNYFKPAFVVTYVFFIIFENVCFLHTQMQYFLT